MPVVLYLGVGWLPYFFCKIHGDYPGPKEIYSNSVVNKLESDFLLIHGASLDARVWNGVLSRNPEKSIVAISLAHHESVIKDAVPKTAASDLVQYLKTHKVNKAIVGHSTASLWIAEAYNLCKECFEDIQIILLAPSFADNIKKSDLATLKAFKKMSFFLPDLMISVGSVEACEGGGGNSYERGYKTYKYNRLFLFKSIKYYKRLV